MNSEFPTLVTPNRRRRVRAGFSILEALLTIAVLSMVAAVAVVVVGGSTDAAKQTRLASDVATVNAAIRTYLTNGGSITSGAKAGDVLASLKTQAASAQARKLPGLRGSMVDPRMAGVEITADGSPRAVWDSAKSRFVISTKGSGYSEFVIDQNAAVVAAKEETRTMTLPLGTESKWVWDFNDNAVAGTAPRSIPATDYTGNLAPASATPLTKLSPPEYTVPGQVYYDKKAFSPSLAVGLRNDVNPADSSEVYYSVNNGPWTRYQEGSSILLSPALTNTIRAYTLPLNPDLYLPSDVRAETYELVLFSGSAAGLFANPKGDQGMVTNLSRLIRGAFGVIYAVVTGQKSESFDWGEPAAGFTKPNNMVFAGNSFDNVGVDETFEIGKLTYFNGTVNVGTIANQVDLEMDLKFTVPDKAKEDMTFLFNLMSTVNEGRNADADADFVYVPKVSTKFSTVVKGQTYYLVLSFGNNSLTSGFTTIDTFHVHENKTATGSVYGRFTRTAPQG